MKNSFKTHHFLVNSSEETVLLGRVLGEHLISPLVIYLVGNLAAGKTTLTRGILGGLGHQGTVKSPTYSYVESYRIIDRVVYHFDLYRLSRPEQLEEIGVRDYFCEEATVLVEWPEKGANTIPKPELVIELKSGGDSAEQRKLSITPIGSVGDEVCQQLRAHHLASGFFVGESQVCGS